MTKNPIINALAAAAYIGGLVSLMSLFVDSKVETIAPLLLPMLMLGLFTLSAAAMVFIFFYQPFIMYFDGQKKEAITLVLQSFGCFAIVVVIVLGIVITVAHS